MAKLFRQVASGPAFTKRRLKKAGIVLLVATLAGAAFLFISKEVKEQAEVAFTIDGKNYSKEEVESLAQYSVQRGGKKDEAAKTAFEYLKRQAAAKKVNIAVTDEEVEAARSTLFPKSKDAFDPDGQPWMDLASYNEALIRKLGSGKVTDASGYVFIFPFDRLLQRTTDYNPTGFGNQTLIMQDRAYAEERARYFRQAIESKQLSAADALMQIKADDRLGQLGMANTNTSIRFEGFASGDASRPERYIPDTAKNAVTELAPKSQVGNVEVGKTVKGEITPDSDDDYQETYFYFVVIDKPSSQGSNKSFEEALKKLSASYKGLN